MCESELPTSRLSKVIVRQTYRESDNLRVVTSDHMTMMAVTQIDPLQLIAMLDANLMALSFIEPDLWATEFLPRCMECRRGLTIRFLSVCLSVCLSNACIVTKRKKDMFKFLYHTKEHLSLSLIHI